MALLPGSPAIGAGVIADYPGTTTPITTDQRGLPLDSPSPDIGAFQSQGFPHSSRRPSRESATRCITYGTSRVTVSGTLNKPVEAPVDESVAVTLTASCSRPRSAPRRLLHHLRTPPASPSPLRRTRSTYAYTGDGNFAAASAIRHV